MSFGITLTLFNINFSRQGHQIELKFSGFSLYPLSFYLNSPFKNWLKDKKNALNNLKKRRLKRLRS